MDCHSNHSVFLRSDGSLACWDDAGSRLTLSAFDPDKDYSRDVVFGPVFKEIRSKLAREEMPFPDYCGDCLILASGACFNPEWQRRKELLIFQVEPSIACTLECPGCMTFAERRLRHGRAGHLDIAIFEKYLADFKADGVSIRTIDFQGHGEPLLNRNVWKMAGLAKSYFPDANISMCTNAHGTYDPAQVHSGIDEVMFAIDGVDQESFETYRVRGSFDRAYGFMKSFCQGAIAEGRPIGTIWKYILFDCNNSPAQLIRAQELAAEAGVQELLFINTQLGLKSSRILSLEDIPRVDTGVKLRISDYLSNFHDTLHSIDRARAALMRGNTEKAAAQLLFATNMIRRRFECIETGDRVPAEYQALVYEILDLAKHEVIDAGTRQTIRGALHAVHDKLDLGLPGAKDLLIAWKTDEIARLADRMGRRPRRGPVSLARSLVESGLRLYERKTDQRLMEARNLIIWWKSKEVIRLAARLDRTPQPDVSVM
ncbi:hypothetical protein OE747_05485 [Ruegeria sp. XHP0148]|uniref:Radical SAM superfamily protein n=2 Tax=Ruegeria aquimaris TaxID=2984333 RepID=A0ABT3AGL7_9RHOB|nr:hypothetical protein [Ruegeria sp. XHP0148]